MNFFSGLALRIKRGHAGLSGNEITFETEGCALGLESALKELDIPCTVLKVGHQHKVRLTHLPAVQAGIQPAQQPAVDSNQPNATPAEIPCPAKINGATKTPKPPQNIPNFIPKASEPNRAPAPPEPKDADRSKRRRFDELAKQEHLETARKLAEEQAQLELSFSPAKGKKKAAKRTK